MIHKITVFVFALSLFFAVPTEAQIKVQSHNDYEQQLPLWNALRYRADFIEADVFAIKGKLLVAHAAEELARAPTLAELYLRPIEKLLKGKDTAQVFRQYGRFSLFIDIKENSAVALPMLYRLMEKYPAILKAGIQIVISGDRGHISEWKNAPPYIQFDGRPTEQYDSATLQRVAMISDSYLNHRGRDAAGNSNIVNFVRHADELGKPARLWATLDDPEIWKALVSLGIKILNTDKIEELRKAFPYE